MVSPATSDSGCHEVARNRRRWSGVVLLILVALLPLSPLQAESEYAVKAAYLYNFVTLIKWPATAHATSTSPVVIGVVGRDPFDGGLENVLSGQKVGSRPLEVRHLRASDIAGLSACHLVFVATTERLPVVAAAVRGAPVAVVGEADNFARGGGMIGFVMKNNKVKLEINRDATQQARLTIPSDLLGIATIVN